MAANELILKDTPDYTFERIEVMTSDSSTAYFVPNGQQVYDHIATRLTVIFIGLALRHEMAWDALMNRLYAVCQPTYVKIEQGYLSPALLKVSQRPEAVASELRIQMQPPHSRISFTLYLSYTYETASAPEPTAVTPASIGMPDIKHIVVTPNMIEGEPDDDTWDGYDVIDD